MSPRLAEFLAGMFVVAIGGVALIGVINAYAPPQDLPWKPLTLAQPVGLATRWKLARTLDEPQACRVFLNQEKVAFSPVADRSDGFCRLEGAVMLKDGAALLSRPPVMSCQLAAAYALWERQVVEPAARELLGSDLKRVEHFGGYSCRTRYGRADTAPSEHARGAAVDIGAFHLADGRRISVKDAWNGSGREAAFLHRVRDQGCGVFQGVLSPDYNAAHHDHLHLDLGAYRMCR